MSKKTSPLKTTEPTKVSQLTKATASNTQTIASLIARKKAKKASPAIEDPIDEALAIEVPTNKEIVVEEGEQAINDTAEVRPRINWVKLGEFATEAEFKEYLKNEGCWGTKGSQKLKKGKKTIYRCNLVTYTGDQCASQTYSLSKFAPEGTPDHGKVIVFWNECEHTHESLPNRTKVVSETVKAKIIEMHKEGKTPMPISFAFRAMKDLPLKDQPSLTVIKNTIAAHKSAQYGEAPITMDDIKKFVDEHLKIPEDDEDKAFVAGFGCSTAEDSDQQFAFCVTTKRLIRQAAEADIIHADATHKVTNEKLLLPIIGTSDGNKQFHLIGLMVTTSESAEAYRIGFESIKDATEAITGEPMKPKYLVADGDHAIHNGFIKVFGEETKIIMCYAHVIMNVDLKYKFRNIANKSLLKDDLRTLYFSATEHIFDMGCQLFQAKWKAKEPEVAGRLQSSFFSSNKNWFIRYCKRVPNTNNYTERFNGTMKTYQLFHQKQPLKIFIHTALTIVEQRSRMYIMDKEKFDH